jgi:pimeloyl-ACP methyl ester carboxylesterase
MVQGRVGFGPPWRGYPRLNSSGPCGNPSDAHKEGVSTIIATIETRVPLSGGDLAFTLAGTGPTILLLIHGLGGTRQTWRHLIPELARTHTVIAPDLPGHGESDPPAGDYSLGAHACALRDLLLALGYGRATLIGHSLGGGVALQAAYQFPDRTDRLMLISSGGLGPEVAPLLRAATLPGAETVVAGLSKIPTAVTRRVLAVLPPLAPSPDAGPLAAVVRGLDGRRQRRAFVQTAKNVIDWHGQSVSAVRQLALLRDVPVLVAWGARDTTIPPHHHRSFAERVPHAVTVEIPAAGHYPHETAPSQLLAAVNTFLTTTTPFQYSEDKWTELLIAPQRQSTTIADTPVTPGQDARWGEAFETRWIVDAAVGALMELRACPQRDAFGELVLAGRETGLGTEQIARALIDFLADDEGQGPNHVAAVSRWRHLRNARARSHPTLHDEPEPVASGAVICYSGVDDSTRC